MILVTGAAGKTGRVVLRALARRGATCRALVRRAGQVDVVQRDGATDVVIGDMQDRQALKRSMEGVRAVYHICPNMHPDEVTIGRAAIDTARSAGVEHFVYHSVLHPQTEAMPHHWHKLRVEERLIESGLDFTALQPAAYMQNILAHWDRIVQEGVYPIPYAARTRLGMVDLEDVAEAAATVLTEPGHRGATYELAGPDVLAQSEIAEILASELGRPVTVEVTPRADWRAQAAVSGLGQYQIETLVKMFEYYERHGFWGNPRALGWLLGRAPTGFAAFVARLAARRSAPDDKEKPA
jgi:NAD(P)H dehydrogenase (quinone)